jgi:hypothetical protein
LIFSIRNTRRLKLDFNHEILSFLREEFKYIGNVLLTFLKVISSTTKIACIRSYQKAITHAFVQLSCRIRGGLFQEDRALYISL